MLGQTLIDTPNGGRIPLQRSATQRWMGERTELDRERLRPVVHVTGRIEGSDLGTAMARVKDRLQGLELPPGVTLEFGGLYAEQQKGVSSTGPGAGRGHRRDVPGAGLGVRRD